MWWFHGIQLDFDIYIYIYTYTVVIFWEFQLEIWWFHGIRTDGDSILLMCSDGLLRIQTTNNGVFMGCNGARHGFVRIQTKISMVYSVRGCDGIEPQILKIPKKKISTMCFLVWGSKQIGGICLLHLYCFLLVRIYIYILIPAAGPRIYVQVYEYSSRRPPNIYIYIYLYPSRRPQNV